MIPDVTNGDSRIIVIDTLSSYESTKKVLNDFIMMFSEKPIKTIIYTQTNSEPLLGTAAFVEEDDGSVEIITSEDVNNHFNDSDNTDVIPTHIFESTFSLNVSDVKINLVASHGEFSDQMYISLPDDDGLLIGDSVYGVGETVVLRAFLYLSLIAISGLGALAFYKLSKKFKNNKIIPIIGYGIFISIVFFLMPENPDAITSPMNLVNEFRLMSVLGVSSFWISVGIVLGLF